MRKNPTRPYPSLLASLASGTKAQVDGDFRRGLETYDAAIVSAQNLKDSYLTGYAAMGALFSALSNALLTAETAPKREFLYKAIGYAELAVKSFEISFYAVPLAWIHGEGMSQCYALLAVQVETEVEKKKALLSQAVLAARRALVSEEFGIPYGHSMTRALYFLSLLEANQDEKVRLLEEALSVGEERVREADRLFNPDDWDRGNTRNYVALVLAELSTATKDLSERIKLLRDACSMMEQCLQICEKSSWDLASIPGIARYKEWYADILLKLHSLEPEKDIGQQAVQALVDAIEYLNKSGQVSTIPTVRWKVAKSFDSVGDFRAASDTFRMAAEDFKIAAGQTPGAGPTFRDLANYMQAWAEIEEARLHHNEEDYLQASESYANASELLRQTDAWTFLSRLCASRYLLEKGEAQSHEENYGQTVETFTEALNGFREIKEALLAALKDTSDSQEKMELEDWLRIARHREAYAHGRMQLEKARVLDRKGEKGSSSRAFASASDTFKTLIAETGTPKERDEIETLSHFCESWARMKDAESRASPELFESAAETFELVRATTGSQALRLLALANSSICRALGSGTRFRLTRDTRFYSEIKRHLETAADYFLEAGFRKTASWTLATQRLFDALVLLADAETERDSKKKAEHYHLAERHLELAAKLYEDAGFPSKRKETLEHLGRTKEAKEVLLSSLEALAKIPTVTTAHLTPTSLTGSQPFGLEELEVARLVGEVKPSERELTVGSNLTLEIDLVNIGKTAATLIKMEDIIPDGCELLRDGVNELLGDSLDLKGRRLDYLKTHTAKILLRVVHGVACEVAPRIVFVDERGSYRSYKFPPVAIAARERGISVRPYTPSDVRIPQDLRFEIQRSREVFQYLVKEFLKDYMSMRIVQEKAGWRTLMELVGHLKLPRSAVYGPEGRTGPPLRELERRGLVEIRVFPEERGRGGAVRKTRVAFENSIVKQLVEKAAMESP